MKLFNLIFTLLFLTFNAVADPIECYWIKATVTTSDNKAYKGYFHVNSKEIQIDHDDLGYFYIQNDKYDLPNDRKRLKTSKNLNTAWLDFIEKDVNFSQDLLKSLHDTLNIYNNTVFLSFETRNGLKSHIARIEAPIKLLPRTIKSITINSIYPEGCFGDSTEWVLKDSDSWIREKILSVKMIRGPIVVCRYYLLCFRPESKEILALINEYELLSEKIIRTMDSKILESQKQLLEKLRLQKCVVIRTQCSC